MSTFNADWLALREPADAAARSRALTERLAHACASRGVVRVLDLGAGTGSNLRYLAEHLPGEQRWLLVDHDTHLLESVTDRMTAWATDRGAGVARSAPVGAGLQTGPDTELVIRGSRASDDRAVTIRVTTRTLDLRAGVDDPDLFAGRHLVTASALIDLVSEDWLRALAARCAENRAIVALALTYDGRITCAPPEPENEMVRDLVNRHQRTDKGLGRAMGPDAAETAHACLAAAGYEVHRAQSDWVLSPEDDQLQRQLIDGWAQAATEIAPDHTAAIKDWRARRLAHVESGHSQIIVGHSDLIARL